MKFKVGGIVKLTYPEYYIILKLTDVNYNTYPDTRMNNLLIFNGVVLFSNNVHYRNHVNRELFGFFEYLTIEEVSDEIMEKIMVEEL